MNGSIHIANLAAMLIYKKFPKMISFYAVFFFYYKLAGVVYNHWLLGTLLNENGGTLSFNLAMQ